MRDFYIVTEDPSVPVLGPYSYHELVTNGIQDYRELVPKEKGFFRNATVKIQFESLMNAVSGAKNEGIIMGVFLGWVIMGFIRYTWR